MIRALVKNRLRSLVGALLGKSRGGNVKKPSKAKIVVFTILYTYLFCVFAAFSVFGSIALGKVLIPLDASWLYFSIFIIASFALTFVFSIFETKSELFECRDNELLLSMPIRPRDIVASRIFVVMIYNYVEEFIIMIPCAAVYFHYSRDVIGVIGVLCVSLFVPLLSTSLASGVGYLVALLSKKIGKNSFITVGISLAFLAAYFYGYNTVMTNFESYIEKLAELGAVAEMPFLYYIGCAAHFKPLSFILIAAVSLGAAALTYVIISSSYIRIVTRNYSAKRTVYKGKYIKEKSPLVALIAKELRCFFSSATYMLNGGLGLVFLLALGVFALIKKEQLIGMCDALITSLHLPPSSTFAVGILAIVVVSSMNMISVCALSLEGKRLWILKTLPISGKDVLIAKALCQLVLATPPTFITSVLVIIALGVSPEYWFFFIATPLLAHFFFSLFGIIINVLFPKFDYVNEAEVVKQSLAVFIVMFSEMIIAAGASIGGIALLFVIDPIFVATLCFILFALLSLVGYLILVGPIQKQYEKIEV